MLVEINQEEKSNLQSLLLPTPPSLPLSTIISSLQSPSEITPTSPSLSPPSLSLPPSSLSLSLSDVAVLLREFLKERKGEEGEGLWGCSDEELMGKYMSEFSLTSLDFIELQSQIQRNFDIYVPSGALFTRLDTTTAATFFEEFVVSRSSSSSLSLPPSSSLSHPQILKAGTSSLSPTFSTTPSRKSSRASARSSRSSRLSRSTIGEEDSLSLVHFPSARSPRSPPTSPNRSPNPSPRSSPSLKMFSKEVRLTEKKVDKLNFDRLSMEGLMLLKERVEEEMREREKEKW